MTETYVYLNIICCKQRPDLKSQWELQGVPKKTVIHV